MRINKYICFVCSLIISISISYFYSAYSFELFTDEEYVKSLNLPPDGDSLGIPIAGAFIVSFLFAIIHLVLHIIIFIFTIIDRRRKFFFQIIESKMWINVLRILNILILVGILVWYVLSFTKLYLNELMFNLTLIISITFYIEWIIFILQRKTIH